jgi:hypothetical protein
MGEGASLGKEAVLADSGWVGEVVAWVKATGGLQPSGAARMTVGRSGREWSRWEPDAGVPHVRIGGGDKGEPIMPTPSVIGMRAWPAHTNGSA